ncbi:MAG: hypothetical protein AB1349_10100 [Elusimicrobiota bacterium]
MIKKITYLLIFLFSFSVLMAHNKNEFEKLNELKEKLRQEKIARVNDKIASYNRVKVLEMKVYSLEDRLVEIKMSVPRKFLKFLSVEVRTG